MKSAGVLVPANSQDKIVIPNTAAGRYLIHLAIELDAKVKARKASAA